MALKIPPGLKLAQLKQIAYKCGIPSSGTKPILTQRLTDDIASPTRHGVQRILSIDMGIRNLAYCVMEWPQVAPGRKDAARPLPVLLDWRRLAVFEAADPAVSNAKDNFEPRAMAIAACNLVRGQLLGAKPTKVLIERQRFRSMGSAHILEWTVRVNMLESMLYAIFQALHDEGRWRGDVVPIAPGRVGPYWVDEEADPSTDNTYKKVRNSKSSKIKNKGLKMDLVRQWLHRQDIMVLGNEQVQATAKAYMAKWDRRPGGKRGVQKGAEASASDDVKKLDDLADCLLQAMAWRDWEHNKMIARDQGILALLDEA